MRKNLGLAAARWHILPRPSIPEPTNLQKSQTQAKDGIKGGETVGSLIRQVMDLHPLAQSETVASLNRSIDKVMSNASPSVHRATGRRKEDSISGSSSEFGRGVGSNGEEGVKRTAWMEAFDDDDGRGVGFSGGESVKRMAWMEGADLMEGARIERERRGDEEMRYFKPLNLDH